MVHIRGDRGRYLRRAAAAETGGNGEILLAIDRESDGESLNRGSKPGLPDCLAGLYVEGPELAIKVADESDSTSRRKHRRQKRRALLDGPVLFHRLHVEGSQLADVPVRAGHFDKAPQSGRAAGAFLE